MLFSCNPYHSVCELTVLYRNDFTIAGQLKERTKVTNDQPNTRKLKQLVMEAII